MFEIDFDKVNWSFLQQALRMKGFAPGWCKCLCRKGVLELERMMAFVIFFQTLEGLRQGDPLYPMLFHIVTDMLATYPSSCRGWCFYPPICG